MLKRFNGYRIQEIYRFGIAGVASFILEYFLLFALTEFLNIYYLSSSALAFIVSLIFNYWISVVYVFKKIKYRNVQTKFYFLGIGLASLGINQLFMWVLVEKIGLYYMVAKIISTIIVMIFNYVLKRLVFMGKL